MNSCKHAVPGAGHELCMLTSCRTVSEDGRRSLIFHGRTDFIPIECGKDLFRLCPFKTSRDGRTISSRGTVKCEHCARAHVPGSLSGRTCKEWASFKRAYHEMRTELPGNRKFYLAGTKTAVYSDDCDEFLRKQLWNKVKVTVLRRDRFTCQDCGGSHRGIARGRNRRSGLEVHHIIPRSLGGTEHPGNLKTVCMDCHRAYTNSTNELMRTVRLEEKLARQNCNCEEEPEEHMGEVDDLAFE